MASGSKTGTIQPCPEPTIYVYPDNRSILGWMVLSSVLLVLWLINARAGRRLRKDNERVAVPPSVPSQPALRVVPPPAPEASEVPAAPPPDYKAKLKEIESALKNYGWKPAEVKAKLVDLDLSLPVEDLIMRILRGGAAK